MHKIDREKLAETVNMRRDCMNREDFDLVRQAAENWLAIGWQPIETAPKNISVLGYIPNAEHYGPGVYRCIKVDLGTGVRWSVTGLHMGRDTGPDYEPTHWMPLPEPPTMIAKAGE